MYDSAIDWFYFQKYEMLFLCHQFQVIINQQLCTIEKSPVAVCVWTQIYFVWIQDDSLLATGSFWIHQQCLWSSWTWFSSAKDEWFLDCRQEAGILIPQASHHPSWRQYWVWKEPLLGHYVHTSRSWGLSRACWSLEGCWGSQSVWEDGQGTSKMDNNFPTPLF